MLRKWSCNETTKITKTFSSSPLIYSVLCTNKHKASRHWIKHCHFSFSPSPIHSVPAPCDRLNIHTSTESSYKFLGLFVGPRTVNMIFFTFWLRTWWSETDSPFQICPKTAWGLLLFPETCDLFDKTSFPFELRKSCLYTKGLKGENINVKSLMSW